MAKPPRSKQRHKEKSIGQDRRQRAFNLTILAIGLVIIVVISAYALTRPTTVTLPPYLNVCIPTVGNPVYVSTPQLNITINGQHLGIPFDIGIVGKCIRPISTRSEGGGVIHIDALLDRDYTLGDFFLVWGNTFGVQYADFSQTQIFGYKVGGNHTLTLMINNQTDMRFQNYPFPRDANFTSNPLHIYITYS